jgi:ribosomal protein S18 acetylase RimI-like enzyme
MSFQSAKNSKTTAFVVQPMAPEDVEEWLQVHHAAFQPTFKMLWNKELSAESWKKLADLRRKSFESPNYHAFKAVDTKTGKIVGAASWKVYERERPAEELNEGRVEVWTIPEINVEARRDFIKGIDEARIRLFAGSRHVHLGTLTVHPDYQRQGIGGLLMQWGIETADK